MVNGKNVTFREKSMEKSPSPKRFEEPEGMTDIDLRRLSEMSGFSDSSVRKFDPKNVKNTMLQILIVFLVVGFATMVFVLIFRQEPIQKHPRVINKIKNYPKQEYWNQWNRQSQDLSNSVNPIQQSEIENSNAKDENVEDLLSNTNNPTIEKKESFYLKPPTNQNPVEENINLSDLYSNSQDILNNGISLNENDQININKNDALENSIVEFVSINLEKLQKCKLEQTIEACCINLKTNESNSAPCNVKTIVDEIKRREEEFSKTQENWLRKLVDNPFDFNKISNGLEAVDLDLAQRNPERDFFERVLESSENLLKSNDPLEIFPHFIETQNLPETNQAEMKKFDFYPNEIHFQSPHFNFDSYKIKLNNPNEMFKVPRNPKNIINIPDLLTKTNSLMDSLPNLLTKTNSLMDSLQSEQQRKNPFWILSPNKVLTERSIKDETKINLLDNSFENNHLDNSIANNIHKVPTERSIKDLTEINLDNRFENNHIDNSIANNIHKNGLNINNPYEIINFLNQEFDNLGGVTDYFENIDKNLVGINNKDISNHKIKIDASMPFELYLKNDGNKPFLKNVNALKNLGENVEHKKKNINNKDISNHKIKNYAFIPFDLNLKNGGIKQFLENVNALKNLGENLEHKKKNIFEEISIEKLFPQSVYLDHRNLNALENTGENVENKENNIFEENLIEELFPQSVYLDHKNVNARKSTGENVENKENNIFEENLIEELFPQSIYLDHKNVNAWKNTGENVENKEKNIFEEISIEELFPQSVNLAQRNLKALKNTGTNVENKENNIFEENLIEELFPQSVYLDHKNVNAWKNTGENVDNKEKNIFEAISIEELFPQSVNLAQRNLNALKNTGTNVDNKENNIFEENLIEDLFPQSVYLDHKNVNAWKNTGKNVENKEKNIFEEISIEELFPESIYLDHKSAKQPKITVNNISPNTIINNKSPEKLIEASSQYVIKTNKSPEGLFKVKSENIINNIKSPEKIIEVSTKNIIDNIKSPEKIIEASTQYIIKTNKSPEKLFKVRSKNIINNIKSPEKIIEVSTENIINNIKSPEKIIEMSTENIINNNVENQLTVSENSPKENINIENNKYVQNHLAVLENSSKEKINIENNKNVQNHLAESENSSKETINIENLKKIGSEIITTFKEIGKNVGDEFHKIEAKINPSVNHLKTTIISNFNNLEKKLEPRLKVLKDFPKQIVEETGNTLQKIKKEIKIIPEEIPNAKKIGENGFHINLNPFNLLNLRAQKNSESTHIKKSFSNKDKLKKGDEIEEIISSNNEDTLKKDYKDETKTSSNEDTLKKEDDKVEKETSSNEDTLKNKDKNDEMETSSNEDALKKKDDEEDGNNISQENESQAEHESLERLESTSVSAVTKPKKNLDNDFQKHGLMLQIIQKNRNSVSPIIINGSGFRGNAEDEQTEKVDENSMEEDNSMKDSVYSDSSDETTEYITTESLSGPFQVTTKIFSMEIPSIQKTDVNLDLNDTNINITFSNPKFKRQAPVYYPRTNTDPMQFQHHNHDQSLYRNNENKIRFHHHGQFDYRGEDEGLNVDEGLGFNENENHRDSHKFNHHQSTNGAYDKADAFSQEHTYHDLNQNGQFSETENNQHQNTYHNMNQQGQFAESHDQLHNTYHAVSQQEQFAETQNNEHQSHYHDVNQQRQFAEMQDYQHQNSYLDVNQLKQFAEPQNTHHQNTYHNVNHQRQFAEPQNKHHQNTYHDVNQQRQFAEPQNTHHDVNQHEKFAETQNNQHQSQYHDVNQAGQLEEIQNHQLQNTYHAVNQQGQFVETQNNEHQNPYHVVNRQRVFAETQNNQHLQDNTFYQQTTHVTQKDNEEHQQPTNLYHEQYHQPTNLHYADPFSNQQWQPQENSHYHQNPQETQANIKHFGANYNQEYKQHADNQKNPDYNVPNQNQVNNVNFYLPGHNVNPPGITYDQHQIERTHNVESQDATTLENKESSTSKGFDVNLGSPTSFSLNLPALPEDEFVSQQHNPLNNPLEFVSQQHNPLNNPLDRSMETVTNNLKEVSEDLFQKNVNSHRENVITATTTDKISEDEYLLGVSNNNEKAQNYHEKIINSNENIKNQINNIGHNFKGANSKIESNNVNLHEAVDENNEFKKEENHVGTQSLTNRRISSEAKMGQFNSAIEDIQSSQHSSFNPNFQKQCIPISPPVGSSLPVFQQQLPYQYDANMRYTQLIPVNLPKPQANSYVINPQITYVTPNIPQTMNGFGTFFSNGQPPPPQVVFSNGQPPPQMVFSNGQPPPPQVVQQQTGPNGQYYICNPISAPNNQVAGIAGVEVRNAEEMVSTALNNMTTRQSERCAMGHELCADNSKCIKTERICDGEVNCDDGSDEVYCSCKYRLGQSRWCDGYYDCPNGEDEVGCFGCEQGFFNCDDWSDTHGSTCIPINLRCNGVSDCPSGTDEQECSVLLEKIETSDDLFKVTNNAGFLHRNYEGKWYPVCSNPEYWALDACKYETGPSVIPPLTRLVPLEHPYDGYYASAGEDNEIHLAQKCLEKRAVYVECPQPTCGIRWVYNNPYRREEVDTSAEEIAARFSPRFRKNNEPLNKEKDTKTSSNETDQDVEFNKKTTLMANLNTTEDILGDGRVVGGRPCQPGAWPWVVSIYKNGAFHCGGVLISDMWLITAAHCTEKYWLYFYEVELGMLRRFSYSPMQQTRYVTDVVPHPGYDRKNLKNDLAMMRLNHPVKFNRYVRPICLPNEYTAGQYYQNGPTPGTVCTAVGWGATVEHGTDPDHMREVDVPVLPVCKHKEDEEGNEICAGLMEGGKDACQGDSGGPFLCRNPNMPQQWYLAGIVSHGEGCARPNEPGVYTKVAIYRDWIYEYAKDDRLPQRKPLNHCPGYTCRSINKCIPKKRRCDRVIDCLHGDDEIDCERGNSFSSLFKHAVKNMMFSYDGLSRSNVERPGNPTTTETVPDDTISTTFKMENSPITDTLNGNGFAKDDSSFASPAAISDRTEFISNAEAATVTTVDVTTVDESPEESISPATVRNKEDGERPAKTDVNRTVMMKPFKGERFLCRKMLEVIPAEKKCDKTVDCQDGTDEESCACADYLNHSHPEAICDGVSDCSDLSDENDCNSSCGGEHFYCRLSKACIPIEKKCDNRPDCDYNEDEWDCFTLADSNRVLLDADSRPALLRSGLLTFNKQNDWVPLCMNYTGIEGKIAADACVTLGFSDYEKFLQVEVPNRKLRIGKEDDILGEVKKSAPCSALYIKCADVSVSGHEIGKEDRLNVAGELHTPPWNAAVYADGEYKCAGTVLNLNWILTSVNCFPGILKLHQHYVAVLAGAFKGYLHVGGPHEQTVRVTEAAHVPDSEVVLLRLEKRFRFTRYVHPLHFKRTGDFIRRTEKCIILGRNQRQESRSVYLRPFQNCTEGFRCFERLDETSASSPECEVSDSVDPWSGCVVCDSGSGFYPAALFHEPRGWCGFSGNFSLQSITPLKPAMFNVMERSELLVRAPPCEGFRCNLGKCIQAQSVCNGIPDCRDSADEEPTMCEDYRRNCHLAGNCSCLSSELRCDNGNCVPKTAFCNQIDDCGDGSDEPDTCNCQAYLRLANSTKICDGVRNCLDKSDEDPMICKCNSNSNQFKCGQSQYCVSNDMVCDGQSNCPNNEDEERCFSLRSSDENFNAGEVLTRSYGIWHPGCFPEHLTTSQLEEICRRIGFAGNSASYLNATASQAGRPVLDTFSSFWVHRGTGRSKIRLSVRSGDRHFVNFVDDPECHRLFLRCL